MLDALYADSATGRPPMPPTQLALATLLQAYTGVSGDDVIEATTMDRRWQLALDCLACDAPPCSKATLSTLRQRRLAHDFDRRLLERTHLVDDVVTRADHDHGNVRGARVRPQPRGDVEPADGGKQQIEHDQVRDQLERAGDAILPSVAHDGLIALKLDRVVDQSRDGRIIVNDHDRGGGRI